MLVGGTPNPYHYILFLLQKTHSLSAKALTLSTVAMNDAFEQLGIHLHISSDSNDSTQQVNLGNYGSGI